MLSFFSGSIVCAQNNKHIVILGDSNTWLGGDGCENKKGWTYWFQKRINPSSCWSYARSGATWTNTKETVRDTEENIGVLGDNNVIMNQVERLDKAIVSGEQPIPDYIIIAAGTNDAWFKDKRPNAYDNDDSYMSIHGSVMLNCITLKARYPKAEIILLTPLQSTAVPLSLIHKTGDIIEQCAKALEAAVIRQDKVMKVVSSQEKKKKRYTYDGTHTSIEGARSNGQYIARWFADR